MESKKRDSPEYDDSEDDEEVKLKKQKILNDLIANSDAMAEDTSGVFCVDDDETYDFKPVSYDEFQKDGFRDNCYGCRHMNNDSLADNDVYMEIMKIYKDHIGTTMSRDAVFRMVKEHFDEYCKDVDEGEEVPEWTLDEIREHFDKHTSFATDEIHKQINICKKLRDNLLSSSIFKKGKETKINNKNVKDIMAIQREIRDLMMLKPKLSTMIGYNENINY